MKTQTAKKLKQFTSKHLPDILTKDPTLLWAKSENTLMVGQLEVKKESTGCYSLSLPGGFKPRFYKQKNAVCYASHYQFANIDTCNYIQILDHKLENYSHDVEHYKLRLTKYLKEGNEEKFLLFYNRYTEALPKLKQMLQECKKSIYLAKYNKI